jgi:hypothetical protein
MRQLKGKVKENAREKRERKKEFMENKEKAFSIGKISVSVSYSLDSDSACCRIRIKSRFGSRPIIIMTNFNMCP